MDLQLRIIALKMHIVKNLLTIKTAAIPTSFDLYSICPIYQKQSKVINTSNLGVFLDSFHRILLISAICCFNLSRESLMLLDNLTLFTGLDAILGILFFLSVHCFCVRYVPWKTFG